MKRLALATVAAATLLLVALGLWYWSSQPEIAQLLKQQGQPTHEAESKQPAGSQSPDSQGLASAPPKVAQPQSAQQAGQPPQSRPEQQQSARQPQQPGASLPGRTEAARDSGSSAVGRPIPLQKLSEVQVRELQQALNQKGFKLDVDGRWGSRTRKALRAFNRSQNIDDNENISVKTLSALGLEAASFEGGTTGQSGSGGPKATPGAPGEKPPTGSGGGI